jgi:uncharacterized membrane protein YbhN (UPF0104 family)
MIEIIHKHLKKYLLLLLGVVFISYVTILVDFDKNKINHILRSFNYLNIIFAVFLYLLSHSARVLRLIILNPKSDYSLRGLLREQYKANGVNLLLPFKLGESYRVICFKYFFGSYSNSFAALLVERFLDLLTIFIILLFCKFVSSLSTSSLDYLLFGSLTLLLIIMLIYYSLEKFTPIINRIFIQKQTNSFSDSIINLTNNLCESIKKIKRILNQRIALCLASSFLIWLLEISAFYIFFDVLNGQLVLIIFLAVAVALSSILPNGPLGYGGVQLAFYSVGITANNPDLVNYSIIYSVFIFGSGLIVASILFLYDFFRVDENV